MKKTIGLIALAAIISATSAYASGYRIPEQSVNSIARAGAYIAHTPGADASYFNPANMSFLGDRSYLEADLMYIKLTSVEYTDNRSSFYSGDSEDENFFLPTLFAVSPDYNNFRVGLSLTYPGGLAKSWNDPYPRTFSEETRLTIAELAASVSYNIKDIASVAAGLRGIYGDATLKSYGLISQSYGGVVASRNMDGDTIEFGYNLAASAKPMDNMNLSVTYRSNVDLDLEGDAALWTNASFAGPPMYNGTGNVTVPLPAVLSVAASYTFIDQLTVELEWDRTYWSEYEQLDINYDTSLRNMFLVAAFDDAKPKNWDDTDAWRIGVEYNMKNGFILMGGFAIDENPSPDSTLGFDLPDSDAKLYSIGMRYQANDNLEVGIAYLYDDKEKRSVSNSMVNGTFTDSAAHLLTVGMAYTF